MITKSKMSVTTVVLLLVVGVVVEHSMKSAADSENSLLTLEQDCEVT